MSADTGSEEKSRFSRAGSVTITGNPEWREWIQDLAASERTTVAGLLDRLAVQHAKQIGFRAAPPRGARVSG